MVLTKIGASLGGSADIINVVQTSHTFVSGDRGKAVYMNDNSGTPQYVRAIATATTTADAIGIIIHVADGNNFTLALSGRITVNACIPSGAAGTVLFLSHTAAGVLTATEPSAAGHVSKPMAVITIAGSEMIMLQQRGEVITTGVIDSHTVASHDTTITGAELTQLTGISANVTDTNLNALTAGSGDTTLHSHAASAGSPTSIWSTGFEAVGRFMTGTTGSGSVTFGTYGVNVQSGGASSGGSGKLAIRFVYGGGTGLHGGSPTWSTTIERNYGQNGAGSAYFGIGSVSVDADGHTYTDDHVGFKGIKVGTTTTIYATQADGTTETASSSLLTAGNQVLKTLMFKVNGTDSVDYYTSTSPGHTVSSATNLTANMMDTNDEEMRWSVASDGTEEQHGFYIGSSSLER